MKVIDLLQRIANGKIEDKRTFNIRFKNGLYRSVYYDKEEENCMCCLKNVSDDYSIYDDISFDDEIETIEEDKKTEEINEIEYYHQYDECWAKDKFYKGQKGNLVDEIIIDKVNEIIKVINEMREDK